MPKLTNRKRELFAIQVASETPLPLAYVAAGYSDGPKAAERAAALASDFEVAGRIDEIAAEFASLRARRPRQG